MQIPPYLVLVQRNKDAYKKDEVGKAYHFPQKYFNQMNSPGAKFVYYSPVKESGGAYFGFGELGAVVPDPDANPDEEDHYIAEILNYRPFGKPVPRTYPDGKFRESGEFYNQLNSVRRIEPTAFEQICCDGGVDLNAEGVDSESSDSGEPNNAPFDSSKIKVDREPASIFQVLRKIELGNIELHPEFQRNLVWDPIRRSRLIESLMLRIPLPAFFFDGVDGNTWQVVDGLQRLSTLRDYISGRTFKLYGLEYLSNFEGKRFDELPRSMQLQIEETQVTMFVIRPDTPPEVKFTIFHRINTAGMPLTAQEIRHALFQGEATKLLLELAESKAFKSATGGAVSDVRMDARECVLRFLAFRITPYTEYVKPDLNSLLSGAMKSINSMAKPQIAKLRMEFTDAMERAEAVFGRYAFRKFDKEPPHRRGPVNKALFESWANVLLDFDKQKLIANRDAIRDGLAARFAADSDYLAALSAGTGGTNAVRTRFETAEIVVNTVLLL